jgi:lysophospholipase L1-like esterase
MNWETILFTGDSLTFGARSYLGYPEYCGHILSEKLQKNWNVINHAVNGFRAIDLARSLDMNYATLSAQTPLITFILIGTNDAKSGTSISDFRIALNQVILKTKLMTMNKNVVVLKIPRLANGVSFPYNMEMNKFISSYNDAIQEMSLEHSIKTMEIEIDENHYYDGVHFNGEGSQFIAEKIASYILHERGI